MKSEVITLLSFLRSLYAVYSAPFPVKDSHCLRQLDSIVILDASRSSFVESPNPPGFMYQAPTSIFYLHFSDLWEALKTVLDAGLLSHLFKTCQMFLAEKGNRWLEITDPQEDIEGRIPPSISRKKERGRRDRTVAKVECMYRTNWNKKYPLGVSNIFHSSVVTSCPEEFARKVFNGKLPSKSAVDMLWEVKLNCSRIDIEHLLGITCPLPKEFEALKFSTTMSTVNFFRNISAVPSLTTCPGKAAMLVSRILETILPNDVFRRSAVSWRQTIKKYLELGRFETLTVPRGTFHADFSFIVFKKIVIPLVSYLFYATEYETDKVVLFRRPVWDVIVSRCSGALVELLGLEQLEENTYSSSCCTVRWLPKKTGFRPVVRQPKLIKDKTKKFLRFLNAVRFLNKEKIVHSVFSRDELEISLREFTRILERNPEKNQVHFFSADIQNCFESIPFEQLEKALCEFADPYLKFSSVMVVTGKLHAVTPRRKRPIVFVKGNLENLIEQSPRSSDPDRPVLVRASQTTLSHERLDYRQVVQAVMKIVRSSAYSLNTKGSTTSREIFRVTRKGLPQGSSFSVMLVSIFYAYIDRTFLKIDPTCTVLTRLVDDMLCLSTRRDEVDRLLYLLVDETVFFGEINQKKLCVGSAPDSVDWAGFNLCPDPVKKRIDVRQQLGPFESMETTKLQKNNSQSLVSFLYRSVAQHCLPLLFCADINSLSGIRANAHTAGRVCGRRIKQWLRNNQLSSEKDFADFASRLKKFPKKIDKNLRRIFRSSLLHSLS